MTLPAGTRFGSYEIAESIGAGGMGEVYRATDMNLRRDVAIKVLPQSFASDAERLARFQREAEVLASLNHVNIAHIYGLERSGGTTALAMELVEGLTLAERIARGPIPVDEALGIARQIAEGLEAAHARGIVHRDLKPANIKLTPDGTVKVLDFGIAKALDMRAASGPRALTTPAMTETGMVLGTAAYMSPEQARGKAVDERADIWAFGCVLYEMLTGQPAFGDEDVTITLARVLERGADLSALPASVSPDVRQAIKLCLQKDLKKRVADIRDVRLALEGGLEIAALQTSPAVSAPRGKQVWVTIAAVAVVGMIALAAPALRHLREMPPPETRVDIVTPATDDPNSFALSPDGRQIVFVASGERGSQLWLRSLATTTAEPLAGTERAVFPFWSPDGRSIGFFADGALKRLDLAGGAARSLAPASNGSGGTWNEDGVIVFAPSLTAPLLRVSAAGGGAAAALTTVAGQQAGHIGPHFLPDGRRFLFYVQGGPDATGIYLGALDGSVSGRLTPADAAGVYLPSGWLLWVREGTLLAQRLDLEPVALTGERVTLADGIGVDIRFRGGLAVAANGLVAYRAGAGSQRQLTWFDRSGTALGTLGDPDGNIQYPALSPDGRQVAVSRTVQGNWDLWVLDGTRMTRFTSDAAREDFPRWSADGTGIVFRSIRTGPGDLYYKLVNGADAEEPLVVSDRLKWPHSWSADGRYLLYGSIDPETNADLWVVPMVGDRTPWVFLKTPFREVYGAFSPNGQWVAYHSNESGRPEVYVRPFVPPGATGTGAGASGGQWQVSTAGGTHPVWGADGRELYYLNPAGAMMAASITVTGGALARGVPEVLFPTRIPYGGADVQQGRQYDVAPDGRFLINTELDDDIGAPITLIQNWNPDRPGGDD